MQPALPAPDFQEAIGVTHHYFHPRWPARVISRSGVTRRPLNNKRSTDEIIVLALGGLCMLGLALFAIIRFLRGDIAIAILDLFGFLAAALLFGYVLKTNDIRLAGPALGIASLLGSLTLLALGEPDDRYLLYPTTVVSFLVMPPLWALTASISAVVIASFLVLPQVDAFTYGKFLLTISGCFLFAYIFARERNTQRDELLSQSTSDPLTGVGNRRAFDEQINELLRIQERNPRTVNLLLLDLDNFKAVNDSRGHDVGDQLLKEIASIISSRMRAGDHAYRFGGDEFALLVMDDGAPTLANDLCQRIREFAQGQRHPVSASIGVAQLHTTDSASTWIKKADKALYLAKQAGRNRIEVHQEAGK